jgi:serine/threonine protein kinase
VALFRHPKQAGSEFFPGFTDVSEIGIGRLATVYRAREIGTNRRVALKLLTVRDASERAVESFERESLALGAVSSHPNIVTLYRFFRAADERPVLVLELCRDPISDRVRHGRGIPVDEAVAAGIKIAGALETAHRAGILHRDVKPQNILTTEFGEPALADFGVAMLQSSAQTTTGLFDFTTLHAAPELLEGGETSAATDVYELASSLYQLIAGRAAFRAYEGESPASVILRILRDPVPPLASAQVPPELSDLLSCAMSKDQGDRPASAAGFAAQLAEMADVQGWARTRFAIRHPDGSAGVVAAAVAPEPRASAAPDLPAPAESAEPVSVSGRHALRIDEAEPDEEFAIEATDRASATTERQYPIPPSATEGEQQSGGAVPRWALRAPAAAQPHDSEQAHKRRRRPHR